MSEPSDEPQTRESSRGLIAAMLGVALIGHLVAYAAWFDEIGHAAGMFVVPAAALATRLYGLRGALLSSAWGFCSNWILGSLLVGPDGAANGFVGTLLEPYFVASHFGLGLLFSSLGRQLDLERLLKRQRRELALAAGRRGTARSERDNAAGDPRAARIERLASVGALAQGVAHEINNPLTYVIANLYCAVDELGKLGEGGRPQLARELEELVRDALDGAERVSRIVRDLERFSRGGDGDGEHRIDVAHAIDMAVNLVRNEIRQRAQLELDIGVLPPVAGSEPRLVQALVNLLMNAAQAIAEGNAGVERVYVSAHLDGGRVLLQVRDTGAGMAPEVQARLFDSSFKARPGSLGAGSGLPVTFDIITSMGGELRVESAPGQGSTFTLHLPVHGSGAVEPAPLTRTSERRRALRVLVIDDEPKVGSSMKRMLRGDEVMVLNDARQALDLLRHDRSFDVVLSDLMMPDVTGMDLHAEVQALDPGFARRFVFMTGGAFSPRARAFVADVPNITLEKPFDAERLRDALATTLRQLGG